MKVKLTPWQTKVFDDQSRYKVLRCGRRAGKTYLSVTLLIYEAMEEKGDYWFIAPFYRQAKSIAWRMLNDLLPEAAISKSNETELTVELHNGSIIELKGADNPDSLRGVGLDGVVMDEYAKTRPFVWEEIVRPMLLDRGGWAMFISTPYGYNHFYDLWEDTVDKKNWKRWHFTSYDNPHIDKEEIEQSRDDMSDEKFQQEIMAEFTKKSGAIWPMFKREYHVVDKRDPKQEASIYASIDFGFAVGHPTHVLFHEVQGEKVYTFDGFEEEGLTIEQIDKRMKGLSGGTDVRAVYPDPARPDLIKQMKDKGWNMVENIDKDVELGISKVAEYMNINPLDNEPNWTISTHLKDTIREIEAYEWDEYRDAEGQFKNKPKKEEDHGPDSLRYFLFNLTKPNPNKDTNRQVRGGNPITGYGGSRRRRPKVRIAN